MTAMSELWPRPNNGSSLVEGREWFTIHVNDDDMLGSFINTVLTHHDDPRRYVLAVFEDRIVAEGLYTRQGARAMVDRLTMVDGNYLDPQDNENPEIKLLTCLQSLQPMMDNQEKKEYERVLLQYYNEKLAGQAGNN